MGGGGIIIILNILFCNKFMQNYLRIIDLKIKNI